MQHFHNWKRSAVSINPEQSGRSRRQIPYLEMCTNGTKTASAIYPDWSHGVVTSAPGPMAPGAAARLSGPGARPCTAATRRSRSQRGLRQSTGRTFQGATVSEQGQCEQPQCAQAARTTHHTAKWRTAGGRPCQAASACSVNPVWPPTLGDSSRRA